MRNAAATGRAVHSGMPRMRAYIHAPDPRRNQPAPSSHASEARRCELGIAVMIALAWLAPLYAGDPPADLAKRGAHRESEDADARRQYAYTQSVRLAEIDGAGAQTGEYREVREVIFSRTGDRTERFSGQPVSRLNRLVMTEEDFADIRNLQPFVMVEDQLRIYQVRYK